MARKVKAMPKRGSKGKRYVIVDVETGEILADANGYGYHTPQKAHAGWAYIEKKQERKHLNHKLNHAFTVENKDIYDAWTDVAIACYQEGRKPVFQDFKKLMDDFAPDFPGDLFSLYLYIEHH